METPFPIKVSITFFTLLLRRSLQSDLNVAPTIRHLLPTYPPISPNQIKILLTYIKWDFFIDFTSCHNQIRDMAFLFCLMDQIVGIDTNTMAANKAWPQIDKVPFGASSVNHFIGIYPKFTENKRELID